MIARAWWGQMLINVQDAVKGVSEETIAMPKRSGGQNAANHNHGQQSLWFRLNFDDDAVFEPLDITLSLLKTDDTILQGLVKLLTIDTCDFLEHPLWKEMLQLLRDAIAHTDPNVASKVRCSSLLQASHERITQLLMLLTHTIGSFASYSTDEGTPGFPSDGRGPKLVGLPVSIVRRPLGGCQYRSAHSGCGQRC